LLLVDEYAPGYGKVAAFEDCDPGFQICRKFLWLHTRVLLHIQDELQELEGTLESLDRWEATQGDRRKLTHRRIDDECEQSPRKELLLQIKGKLEEYDEILFRMQKKQAMKRPTKRNQNSVYNLINTSKSMGSSEALWIRQWDDLAALAHDTEHGWFHGAIEDLLRVISPTITLVGIFFPLPSPTTAVGLAIAQFLPGQSHIRKLLLRSYVSRNFLSLLLSIL